MDTNGFPDPDLVAAEHSDSVALADRYGLCLEAVISLMHDARDLSKYGEDVAWQTFANRLQYPAHYRFSKKQLAELLSGALGMLMDVRAVHEELKAQGK